MNHFGRSSGTGELSIESQSTESSESDDSPSDRETCCVCCREQGANDFEGRSPLTIFCLEVLHGVSQVCFFTSPLAGAAFLVAVLVGKPRAAILLGLLGVLSATGFSCCLGLDVDARREGLLGYNAMLVGCAFAFAVTDFWWAALVTVPAAAMSAFVAAGLLKVLRPQLTLAFNLAALTTLALLHLKDDTYDAGATIHGVTWISVFPQLSGLECLTAILNGVAQIFFVASPISGLIILVGIGLAGPSIAFNTLLGSLVATLGAAKCGADLPRLKQGIWGYNAALTALWICFYFKKLGCFPVLFLVFCGAAAGTAVFAALDVVVGLTNGFAPSCFTMPFNTVALSFVAVYSLIQNMRSMAKTKPSPECEEQCQA